MKNIVIGVLIFFYSIVMYWGFIVSSSTEFRKKGNDYALKSLLASFSNKPKSDSLKALSGYYYQKADERLLLVPKCFRP